MKLGHCWDVRGVSVGVFEHFWSTFCRKFAGPEIAPGGVFLTSGGPQKVNGVVSGAKFEGQFLAKN